jgi:hypothetical protein
MDFDQNVATKESVLPSLYLSILNVKNTTYITNICVPKTSSPSGMPAIDNNNNCKIMMDNTTVPLTTSQLTEMMYLAN